MAKFMTLFFEGSAVTFDTTEVHRVDFREYEAGYVETKKKWFRKRVVVNDTRRTEYSVLVKFKKSCLDPYYRSFTNKKAAEETFKLISKELVKE